MELRPLESKPRTDQQKVGKLDYVADFCPCAKLDVVFFSGHIIITYCPMNFKFCSVYHSSRVNNKQITKILNFKNKDGGSAGLRWVLLMLQH